jgi:hypothetical protein
VLDFIRPNADVNVPGNLGSFDCDAFRWGLPVHHSAHDWGQRAEAFFDDGVEVVEFGEVGMV